MRQDGNILYPDDGMVLTNGEVYSYKVYLGRADSPENWHDVEPPEEPE